MRGPQLVLAAVIAAASSGALAQAPTVVERGAEFYRTACAQCHGADGKGGGPVAPYMTPKPSDLTTLARRNNGTFPFYRVFQIVDGRQELLQHGPRDMPLWGSIFQLEAGDRYGQLMRETYVRGRIYELVMYVDSIQQR